MEGNHENDDDDQFQSITSRAFRAFEENGGPSVSKRTAKGGGSGEGVTEEEDETESGDQRRPAPFYKCGSRRLREGIANEQMSETEGERQLKRLLDKQLDKTVTLEDQFVRHRAFQSAVTYIPLTTELSGQMTMGQFRIEESRKERVDDLRQLGLNEDEIRMTLERSETLNAGLGKEPGVLRDQLSLIEDKITARTEEISRLHSFRDAKVVSRHEMELEKSLKPNSQQAQLLMQLMTMERAKSERSIENVPIDILKEMERELTERVDRIHENKTQRKRKPSDETELGNAEYDQQSGFGPWEVVQSPVVVSTKKIKAQKEISAKVVDEVDPVIRDYVVPVSEEEIDTNRLCLEEITRQPRFLDYVPGEPTNVLYVKNLVQSVKETDLVALFGRFQKDKELEYRLMKGKMRGQAFVTFPDINLATEALNFINGFVWKGKPVIIQYGRQMKR